MAHCHLGATRHHLGADFCHFGAILRSFGGRFGADFCHFGVFLCLSQSQLIWEQFEAILVPFGGSLEPLNDILGRSDVILLPFPSILEPFGATLVPCCHQSWSGLDQRHKTAFNPTFWPQNLLKKGLKNGGKET